MNRLWTSLDLVMSSQTHNICVWTALATWAGSVGTVLIAPNDLRLSMAKDVGVVLMGLLGVVATSHTVKEFGRGVPPVNPRESVVGISTPQTAASTPDNP